MKGRTHNPYIAEKMIQHNYIKEFKEIEAYISKVQFGKSIGVGYKRLNKIFDDDISHISLGEIYKASKVLRVDFKAILKIALRQFQREINENGKNTK